ncbi:MAG: condensation domain-containing protein [Aquabacterium sp.]
MALPLAEHDWRGRSSTNPQQLEQLQQDLDQLAQQELAQGFDLLQPPLMRLVLVRTADDRQHFIWTMHHLLLDGWSTAQLMGEVLRHYGGESLPVQGGRYRDYIGWLQAQDAQASEAYWREQLRFIDEPTRLLGAPAQPTQTSGDQHAQGAHGFSVHTHEFSETATARPPATGPPRTRHAQHIGAGRLGLAAEPPYRPGHGGIRHDNGRAPG